MTVKDLIKRLQKSDENKMVIFIGSDNGWCNIDVFENKVEVIIRCCERHSPFSSE